MVAQGSKRTLAHPTNPHDPARTFNERGQGIMRKLYTYKESLSAFGVEVGLLIRTPCVDFVYETQDDMIRNYTANVAESNRYRPQDVKDYFRGRVLRCPSILSMSPLSTASGTSSPALSSTSSTSLSAADTAQVQVKVKQAQELGPSLPGSDLVSDPCSTAPAMDISSLLNSTHWPGSPFPGEARLSEWRQQTSSCSSLPASDTSNRTSPPAMLRPFRPWTPTRPNGSVSSSSPKSSSSYRVLKIRTPGKPRRNWFDETTT
ncbi:hypothetical protein BR93DRAFT_935205 [Coniochaeta sp. PMI_546]|nr:hypothetical protein BR93DRAFT_935205 [Coniochaeta sp. PMI_546]